MILALGVLEWALFAGLGVVLIVILWKLFGGGNKRSAPTAEALVDLANLGVKDARKGDMITVRGAGADYEDLTFKVDKRNRYEWGDHEWYELVGKTPSGRVHLTWEDDDELQVDLNLPGNEHRIDEFGLTEDDLMRFDQEQAARNSIQFQGITYHYDMSSEVGFFEDEQGDGEGFYLWSFDSDDARHNLSIEKWEGEAFNASVSQYLLPDDVRVYRS